MNEKRQLAPLNPAAWPIAIGLAIFFTAIQTGLYFASGFAINAFANSFGYRGTLNDIAAVIFSTLFLWTHALFVLLVADAARAPSLPAPFRTRLVASLPLAVVFGVFAWLEGGNQYSCGEGHLLRESPIPILPWLWICWGGVTLLALPAHFAAWAAGQRAHLVPIWQRVILMAPYAAAIWFLGLPHQNRPPDCTAPREGWGLFEGGVVAIPLLALFLFVMSTSMAVLMAEFRRS